jgi:hypothetical protein
MALIGHARVSMEEQNLALQLDALRAAAARPFTRIRLPASFPVGKDWLTP